MSTKITSSASSCYFSCNNKESRNNLNPTYFGPYNLATINRAPKIDRYHNRFLKFSAKYGISMSKSMSISNIQPRASSSPDPSSSSSWKKWLLGILLTVILPAVGHKGGLFVALKAKIDKTLETVEHVAEAVEEIAEKAEKIVEEVEEKLPEDSKLKETLDSFEILAKNAVKEAKKADELAHKVKDVEQEIEASMVKAGTDQAK